MKTMRLLLIHPTHPSTPHISAVRMWRFAQEMAKRGHHVALLCAPPKGGQATHIAEVARHDWQAPFLLACETGRAGWLDKDRLPSYARKMVTAWRMLHRGGDLGRWADNIVRAAHKLGRTFMPDLVWTTFGFMEAVIAARRAARTLQCPWVLDIKDNWELCVPFGLRRLMAARTLGWAALTANASFTQVKASRWQRDEATVVYSGIDDAFFGDGHRVKLEDDLFVVNLIGGLYFQDRLEEFLAGIRQWTARLTPQERDRVQLRYLGGNAQMFEEAAARADLGIPYKSLGYRPVAEMAGHCRQAVVNAYIATPLGFHHKLLELLASAKPVLAFPDEDEEARTLALQVAGDLRTPSTAEAVAAELARLHSEWQPGTASSPDPATLRAYSWASQAEILEQTFQRVLSGKGRQHE